VKTYYQLFGIAPAATADEVRRAFRAQIARYHPDKVHHLGEEFQAMAAERAAELTEAYRVLSDEQRRAAYDCALASTGHPSPAAAAPPPPPAAHREKPDADGRAAGAEQFSRDRATRDRVVRRATVTRFDHALAGAGEYDRLDVNGFDFAWQPKSRLFGRGKGPRLAGRLVARVDGDSIAAAFTDAGKWSAADEVCVFLMGDEVAAAGELARAIAGHRRRAAAARVTVVPVDARTWDAHVPTETPPIAKRVLERVRTGR
jgi:DnaJ domain